MTTMDDETIRHLFNKFCGSFASGYITDPDEFSNGFAEAIRAAYSKGWHQGWRDAPSDEW